MACVAIKRSCSFPVAEAVGVRMFPWEIYPLLISRRGKRRQKTRRQKTPAHGTPILRIAFLGGTASTGSARQQGNSAQKTATDG